MTDSVGFVIGHLALVIGKSIASKLSAMDFPFRACLPKCNEGMGQG
jgi:hypothetical protein